MQDNYDNMINWMSSILHFNAAMEFYWHCKEETVNVKCRHKYRLIAKVLKMRMCMLFSSNPIIVQN